MSPIVLDQKLVAKISECIDKRLFRFKGIATRSILLNPSQLVIGFFDKKDCKGGTSDDNIKSLICSVNVFANNSSDVIVCIEHKDWKYTIEHDRNIKDIVYKLLLDLVRNA